MSYGVALALKNLNDSRKKRMFSDSTFDSEPTRGVQQSSKMRHYVKEFEFIEKDAAIKAYETVANVFNETAMARDKDPYPIQLHSEELMALYEIAAGLHNPPDTEGIIVNIGTAKGGSACIMAHALKAWGHGLGTLILWIAFILITQN